MSSTTKKLAEAFLRYQKETGRANPHARCIGPGPRPRTAEGAVPIADYERAGAADQIEQIAVMAQPVIERFGVQEQKLVAALQKLISQLHRLVAQGEVKKQAQAPMPFRKRFIRVVDPEVKVTVVDANSIDGMLVDATRRVRKNREDH